MEKKEIVWMDVRIAAAAVICYLTAEILEAFHIGITYDGRNLEVLQRMTAMISCLLVCQDSVKISWKAGLNRIVITLIGGLAGIGVILLDNIISKEVFFVFLIGAGLLVTLMCCRQAGVPAMTARIGGVTFVLVICTLSGNARILYGVLRLVSTLYGVVVSLVVTWIFEKISSKNSREGAVCYENQRSH